MKFLDERRIIFLCSNLHGLRSQIREAEIHGLFDWNNQNETSGKII